MGPWKKFLPKSANLSKYEKEEQQKYKQYVKIEKQNAQLRSKPESEVYEDLLLLRTRSSRRSSKKKKAPVPQTIENAYEVLENRTLSSNVVVINDDLRNRFAGYETPRLQNHQDEVDKPRRLRWKKEVPAPPQTNEERSLPHPPIGEEQNSSKSLRVPEDDAPDTSMSEVYYDCDEYSEILSPAAETFAAPPEDLESRKSDRAYFATAGSSTNIGRPNPNPIPIQTNPNYVDTPEAQSVEYEYIYTEDEGCYENQKVNNRFVVEDFGYEDESRWQPSDVRFLEMSGDEDEQQIYGPYGTIEVAQFQDTLNSRIQMILEAERQTVMQSLESQRDEEVAANLEDFGAVGRSDEELSPTQARNTALIEVHETTASNLQEEIHEETKRDDVEPIPFDLREVREDPARNPPLKNSIGIVDFTAENEPTYYNLHEARNEDGNVAASNLREEIREDPKRDEGASSVKHPIILNPFDLRAKNPLNESHPSKLHEEFHGEPQKAKPGNFDLISSTHQNVTKSDEEEENKKMVPKEIPPPLETVETETRQNEPTPFNNLHEEIREVPQKDSGDFLAAAILITVKTDDFNPTEAPRDNTLRDRIDKAIANNDGEEEDMNEVARKKVPPPTEEGGVPQAEAETKTDQSSLNMFDNYSIFFKDPMSMVSPRSSKSEEDIPRKGSEEDVEYENFQFNQSTKLKEEPPRLKKTWQDTAGPHRNPVAQPRPSLSKVKPARNINKPENPKHADLFNGLPVESASWKPDKRRAISGERDEGNPWEPQTVSSHLLNGLPVPSSADVIGGARQKENVKIPWETKPKTSSIDDDFTINPSKFKEEEDPRRPLKIPWKTRPKTYPNDEDFFAFSGNSKQKEVGSGRFPWETKPQTPTYDRNFEEDSRMLFGRTRKNPSYETSHELFNPHDVSARTNVTSESEEDLKKTTSGFSDGEKSFGGITNPNFDGGGVILRKSTEDCLEEKLDSPSQPDPEFYENFQNGAFAFPDGNWGELGGDFTKSQIHDLRESNSVDGLKQDDFGKASNSSFENSQFEFERDHSLKQKTWHVTLRDKYFMENAKRHGNEAGGKKIDPNLKHPPQVNPNEEDDKQERQNEANILEENYRILRGFDVAREEGVVYQNISVDLPPDSEPPQRPTKKTKIPKKVSFRISEVDEGPKKYVSVHSPTDENGHIKKSAKLEEITRKLEKSPSLQHSISLTEPERPKPNFATFPRNAGRTQSSSKSGDLEKLQQVLAGIKDLASIHEQVSAMEGVSAKVKETVTNFEKSEIQDEYSELLQIVFRSVRIATGLDCGFDPDLLGRQQTLLDDIRNSIATLNSN